MRSSAACSMRSASLAWRATPSWCSPSNNGPDGPAVRAFGGAMPDIAFSGPYRGALGDVSEGSIRTAAIIRWSGRITPRSSYAMFSIMDFFPTFARLAGGKVPTDRSIDGVDQTDVLLNGNDTGHREHLLTFVDPDLVAARWKQFRAYFADVAPGRSGGGGATLLGGVGSSAAPMNGYPKVFNIEADRARSTTSARCTSGCSDRC